MDRKYQVFKQNYELIQRHNSGQGYVLGVNQFSDMTEEEFLEVYGKGLLERPAVSHKLGGSWGNDDQEYQEYDEKGRYHCRHDDELHDYFDYNDYNYIDNNLKTCGSSVNWVTAGKVGPVKQ